MAAIPDPSVDQWLATLPPEDRKLLLSALHDSRAAMAKRRDMRTAHVMQLIERVEGVHHEMKSRGA